MHLYLIQDSVRDYNSKISNSYLKIIHWSCRPDISCDRIERYDKGYSLEPQRRKTKIIGWTDRFL